MLHYGFFLAAGRRVNPSKQSIHMQGAHLSMFYGDIRPIVHRAGGMLLQAKKEFAICGDLKPEDVFFYYTTTCVSFPRPDRFLMRM